MDNTNINNIDLDNPEFQQAYKLLKNTNANVFLTGKAGTGKSTFLKYICHNLNKNHIVLAPTGVAAVNVGGVTIHSFFQMPLRPVPPDDPEYSVKALKKSGKLSKRKRKLIQQLDLIVIDEVSMVRPDMIDFIDRTLRAVTDNRKKPFGGIQLLLVGDIFQLEPVITNESKPILAKYYSDFFFFNANVYSSANLISIELKKIYRQSDNDFINLLDRIRINKMTDRDMNLLYNRASLPSPLQGHDMFGITLTSRRDSAARINKERMDLLPEEEYVFEGEIHDDFPEKILPTDLSLVLKKNAQVMMIRNDKEKKWVNGTLARICDISPDRISVQLENGKIFNVEKELWQNINYVFDEKEKKVKEEIIGTFSQYPLKAAWALTIHKSQGLTFNNVTIDLTGGAFSAGQTYVALSRCRTLEGIRFLNPIHRSDIIVSKGAADYSRNYNDHAAVENALMNARASELSLMLRQQFNHCDFEDAVESLWEIHNLTGLLNKRSVRKLVARYLNIIATLKKELKSKNKILKDLSGEYTQMGYDCLLEANDTDAAYRNFNKALKIDASNKKASLGMAKVFIKNGKIKKASEILDEFIKTNDKHTFEARILKGDIAFKDNDLSTAAIHYNAAAKLDKKNKIPIMKLIEVYTKSGLDYLADQYLDFLKENWDIDKD